MNFSTMRSLMQDLNLKGMATLAEKLILEGLRHECAVEEIIEALLQSEIDFRKRRRTLLNIKASKIKGSASFEDFDLHAKRSITRGEIRQIMNLGWVKEARPVLLVGQTGVGKSYIAQAAGLRACEQGFTVYFSSVTRWLEEQAQARATGGYLKFREKLIKPDLLILDDFGLRKFNPLEAEDFREILEERSYGKAILITTQLPLNHWSEVIADPVLCEAITDRLEGPALIYKITGESYRKVKAQKLAEESKEK